jgi:hypothetical protein
MASDAAKQALVTLLLKDSRKIVSLDISRGHFTCTIYYAGLGSRCIVREPSCYY